MMNDFKIESKYHHKTVVLLLTDHMLSLQDVVFQSVFFLRAVARAVIGGGGVYSYIRVMTN